MGSGTFIKRAEENRKKAYAPYSGYMVGAILATKDGKVYDGANIETSLHHSNHAERVALDKAVFEGARKGDIDRLVISTNDENNPFPCPICLADLAEFDDGGMKITATNIQGRQRTATLAELLPNYFNE